MKKLFTLSMILLITLNVYPQSPEQVQIEAMKKLNWLTGEWKGIAYTQMGPAKHDTVYMFETLESDLNGTIIQVRGTGYMDDKHQDVAHDAVAVIYFDPVTKKYKYHAWRVPGGFYVEYEPEITDNSLAWKMDTPQGKMRYKLIVDDQKKWHEVGEFSRDGQNWMKFFEMFLEKQ